MTIEICSLLVLAAVCLVLPFIHGALYKRQVGAAGLIGNRENLPKPEGAAGRGARAHSNLVENLVPYTAVVLAAQAAGVSNRVTATAAIVFVVARVLHAAFYLLGITGLRTLAYVAGVVATAVIGVQVVLH